VGNCHRSVKVKVNGFINGFRGLEFLALKFDKLKMLQKNKRLSMWHYAWRLPDLQIRVMRFKSTVNDLHGKMIARRRTTFSMAHTQ